MKSSKTTTILINVALVLLAAILIKFLIAAPYSANAAPNRSYFIQSIGAKNFERDAYIELNNAANKGWRLISAVYNTTDDRISLILER
jgi:hypothetical protein